MYRTGFRDAGVASEVLLSSLEWWSIYGNWVLYLVKSHTTGLSIRIS